MEANSGSPRKSEDANDGGPLPPRRLHLVMLRCFHLVWYVLLGVVAIIVGAHVTPFDFLAPSTWGLADNADKIGKSSDLSYPIFLGGSKCYEYDLAICDSANPDSSTCCEQLFDPNSSGPWESVSTSELAVVAAVIPIFGLLLRTLFLGNRRDALYRRVAGLVWRRKNGPDALLGQRTLAWRYYAGFSNWDAWLGLLASLALASFTTELTKFIVGRPRPNYYALLYFGEHSVSDQGAITAATRHANTSWVSGHSSLSVAGILYLTLVMWADVSAWPRRFRSSWIPLAMSIMYFVLIWLPLLSLLVGMSRIRDYWHRPEDVLAGWMVGALCAVYGWRVVTLHPWLTFGAKMTAAARAQAYGAYPERSPRPASEDAAERGIGSSMALDDLGSRRTVDGLEVA